MSDSNRVADALNSISESNLRGHVDESELHKLINDYFGSTDDAESDSESDDSSLSEAESISATDNVVGLASAISDDDVLDDDLVTADEVPSVLGTSAHKIPDAVCESDEEELERIKSFTCHCQHYKNGPCYGQFTTELVLNRRSEMKSLTEGNLASTFVCLIIIIIIIIMGSMKISRRNPCSPFFSVSYSINRHKII